VATDLRQRGRDLGQTEAVAAETFGDRQRRHTAGDQRVPAVAAIQHRRHHVGDSLLPLLGTEIHPNPP